MPAIEDPEVAMSPRRNPQKESIRDPLPGQRERLASEYGGVVAGERIDREAELALGELQGARIREYVPVFAWRRARTAAPKLLTG